MRTMQEALAEAEKYAPYCEALAVRMEEGKAVLERARAEQAERALTAEEVAAAAAAAAAEALQTRVRKEEEYREEQRKRAELNAIKRKEKADRKKAQRMEAEAEAEAAAAERAAAAAAAEAAEAAAEAAEAKRKLHVQLHMERELESLNQMMRSTELRVQEVQAQLGIVPQPAPAADESLCVVCVDAPKNHILLPCRHMCVCQVCAPRLQGMPTPCCPVCRAPIEQTLHVFL